MQDFRRVHVKFPRGGFSFLSGLLPKSARRRFPSAKNDLLLLDIFINDGAEVTVEGLGMPFANSDHPEIEGWLNRFEPVANEMTLIDIFNQRDFTIVVDAEERISDMWNEANLPPPFSYPYGNNHFWNENRLRSRIHDNKGPQFLPAWTYGDDNAHLAAMTQSEIQDMGWLYDATIKIARHKLPAYFVDSNQANGDKAYFVVIPSVKFQTRYGPAWSQITSNWKSLDLRIHNGTQRMRWDARIQEHDELISHFKSKHHIEKTDLVLYVQRQHQPYFSIITFPDRITADAARKQNDGQ